MDILKTSVGVLWLINLGLLIWYMVEQEVNGWNIAALIGVALTGIVPILFRRDKKREGWAALAHVISGVIGTAGSGLALGYAAQCGKSSYDHIELLIAAAVVNGLSGVVAHIAYIEKPTADYGTLEDYNNNRPFAAGVAGSSYYSRRTWIVGIWVASCACLFGHMFSNSNYEHVCTNTDHYMWYFLSSMVHIVAFSLLWACIKCMHPYLLYSIYTAAGVLSMFGAMITHGYWGDILLTVVVYLYLALAHLL